MWHEQRSRSGGHIAPGSYTPWASWNAPIGEVPSAKLAESASFKALPRPPISRKKVGGPGVGYYRPETALPSVHVDDPRRPSSAFVAPSRSQPVAFRAGHIEPPVERKPPRLAMRGASRLQFDSGEVRLARSAVPTDENAPRGGPINLAALYDNGGSNLDHMRQTKKVLIKILGPKAGYREFHRPAQRLMDTIETESMERAERLVMLTSKTLESELVNIM